VEKSQERENNGEEIARGMLTPQPITERIENFALSPFEKPRIAHRPNGLGDAGARGVCVGPD
jgi:hypothetical protein